MRWGYCFFVIGTLLLTIGLTMLVPLAVAIYYGDTGVYPLLFAFLLTTLTGGLLFTFFRTHKAGSMSHREGMVIVACVWIAACLAGALPFWFGDVFPDITDCVFESVSGFTTTGSSVLGNIEAVSRSILLWRSITHWLGGMGIIVLSLAILPFLGIGGMQLYKAEVPGPVADKLTPRIKDTALLLWKVYVLFTLLLTLLLWLGGMDIFESVNHAFSTMATGGFSVKNISIEAYNSVYIDVVITLFMLLGGINFALHYQLLRGNYKKVTQDAEIRFFLFLFVGCTFFTTLSLWGDHYEHWWTALRYAAFQIASILTTTGFATADFELWSPFVQTMIIFLMVTGGSAGSTSGGMKCMRVLIMCKQSYSQLYRLIHPRAVNRLKLNDRPVYNEVIYSIVGYVFLFLGLFAFSGLALTALGMDIVSGFSAAASSLGNIGPGLESVGPAHNFSEVPLAGKWILIVNMLLGRLEIYTLLILCVPEFWRS